MTNACRRDGLVTKLTVTRVSLAAFMMGMSFEEELLVADLPFVKPAVTGVR